MSISFRRYQYIEDYQWVSAFLINHYQPGNRDGNWLEPAWEYMHSHPCLTPDFLNRIGIWEDQNEIVAAAHYECSLGEAFLQVKPGYQYLYPQMLDHAERNLRTAEGELVVFVNSADYALTKLVQSRGYQQIPEDDRPLARLSIPNPFPETSLPPGYRLLSLAEEPDWAKVHRVMWRGFNHPGEPEITPDELAMRRKMFDTLTARRDLKVVVAAPDGAFVAICGMFYQPQNRYAYVEPVATDPDHRRMGLGKAAVLEGIRRCAALGAMDAFVGSDQPFYLALGFEVVQVSQCWHAPTQHR